MDTIEDKQKLLAIGNQLKKIRLDKGFTQTQLAELSGVSQTAICQIELGQYKIELAMALRLAFTLSCSLDYLLCRNMQYNTLTGQLVAAFEQLDIPRQKMFLAFIQQQLSLEK